MVYGQAACDRLKNSLTQKIQRGDFAHYKTEREKVARYVQRHQLHSVMNHSKWQALRTAMNALDCRPAFIVKYLLGDDGDALDFDGIPRYAGDWSVVHFLGSFTIEWLKIHGKLSSFQGYLLPDVISDFGDEVQAALEQQHIPYEKHGDIFTIFGYRRLVSPHDNTAN